MSVSQTPSLETKNLTIRFGGHAAVNNVSCAFQPGELTVIVGPNGAGKTTWFNLVSGQLTPTEGAIFKDGKDISDLAPSARANEGIGRAFQLTNLFPRLSVFENVRLAVQAKMGVGFNLFRPAKQYRDIAEKAHIHLKAALPDRPHHSLSPLES